VLEKKDGREPTSRGARQKGLQVEKTPRGITKEICDLVGCEHEQKGQKGRCPGGTVPGSWRGGVAFSGRKGGVTGNGANTGRKKRPKRGEKDGSETKTEYW